MGQTKKKNVLARIEKKFKDEIFTKGEYSGTDRYTTSRGNLREVPYEERTPGLCAGMLSYCRGKLIDVPEFARTREFFIESYCDNEVSDYIKNHINDFDRQFFKDLIVSVNYATSFENNCFAVMPVEYIDEEMCSLAILNATGWSDDAWFRSVYERKPEALTADLWKRGARLYSRMSGNNNEFLTITPEEFKDEEYYKEMCSCNYNVGMALYSNKGNIMESIPKEAVTEKLLTELLAENLEYIAMFSEEALERPILVSKENNYYLKMWQIAVRKNGYVMKNIKFNKERIEFFLNYYDKDSSEYKYGFKDYYKKYLKEKNNPEDLEKAARRERNNLLTTGESVLLNAMIYSIEGENPTKAVEDQIKRDEEHDTSLVPIEYRGMVPIELAKEYDSEEYLLMMYKELGIHIYEEFDSLLYIADIPENWNTVNNGYWYYIQDETGKTIIKYLYCGKFYDREAYVKEIDIPESKMDDIIKRALKR